MAPETEGNNTPILERARNHFVKTISEGTPIYLYFPQHIREVERWARRILVFHPEADSEVVLLGVYLHDIGQADGKYTEDHAVKSEAETIQFLTSEGYPNERIKQVAHCVRAHRCRDVQPETLEAKILASADSTSHMTDVVYIIMLSQTHLTREHILEKLRRDYRDINFLPDELKQELQPLYEAWEKLIKVFPK